MSVIWRRKVVAWVVDEVGCVMREAKKVDVNVKWASPKNDKRPTPPRQWCKRKHRRAQCLQQLQHNRAYASTTHIHLLHSTKSTEAFPFSFNIHIFLSVARCRGENTLCVCVCGSLCVTLSMLLAPQGMETHTKRNEKGIDSESE